MTEVVLSKPTLHEIAAMPFPASRDAMRRYYNKDWGKPVPEDGRMREFDVTIRYSVTRYEFYTETIEAFSSEEAEKIASDNICNFEADGDIDFDEVKVRELEQ